MGKIKDYKFVKFENEKWIDITRDIIVNSKKFVLGQYFTKEAIVEKVLSLLLQYKDYDKNIKILEPSAGKCRTLLKF